MGSNMSKAYAFAEPQCAGSFVQLDGETHYKISHVDQMPPFFISLVSDNDHWLFAGSTGGLTMGRVSPETSLFPYVTVDRLYESLPHTGPKTLIKVSLDDGKSLIWEPFNTEHNDRFHISRHLYKNTLGNVLTFEEINHDLNLVYRYQWRFSEAFGICRQSKLINQGSHTRSAEILDGLQNLLPAGTPRFTQTVSSNLVDAYKWTERDETSGLALYTLYSAITDRAEPVEALRANTVFGLCDQDHNIYLTADCVAQFKRGSLAPPALSARGVRSSFFMHQSVSLAANTSSEWTIVANVEQDQQQIAHLQQQLKDPAAVVKALVESQQRGSDNLARIMASADGFQTTAEEEVSLHHYANTLFNVLRGGIFADQYKISRDDIAKTLEHFNKPVFAQHQAALNQLDETISLGQLLQFAEQQSDPQLQRIIQEYLPMSPLEPVRNRINR